MTTAEFELAAKQALIQYLDEEFGEKYKIEDIQVVWMCHIIGDKKCLLIDNSRSMRYYEVTWNAPVQEMYLDVYEKTDKRELEWDEVQKLMKGQT